MRRRPLLAATLAVVSAVPAAAQGLDDLLRPLGPVKAVPQGAVAVRGWIERAAEGSALVIVLEPSGAARLVADPGITVEPVAVEGVRWTAALPLTVVDTTRDYFATAPVLKLPFTGTAPAVEARVDYAWCLADYQCLFGEAVVRVATVGG